MKILIAATEPKLQLAVSLLAPPPCHRVRPFGNSTDAILSICRASERNVPYQVVVIDLELADWFDIAEFIRQLDREMDWRSELIFLSTRDELEPRLDAANLRAAGYIVCPDRAAELRRLIEALER